MEQTKALDALAPFLALIKTPSPKAVADVIQRATSATDTYIFYELLSTPQAQSLKAEAEYYRFFSLLQQFTYGNTETYSSALDAGSVPPLNAAQTLKLKQLSLLACAKNTHNLTYAELQKLLDIGSVGELEEFMTTTIYQGLVAARLDPKEQRVSVTSVAPLRDVQTGETNQLKFQLEQWSERCTSTLEDLEKQIVEIKDAALAKHKEHQEWETTVKMLMDDGKKKGSKKGTANRTNTKNKKEFLGLGGGRSGGHEDVDMDEDDDEGHIRASPTRMQRTKKRGVSTFFRKGR